MVERILAALAAIFLLTWLVIWPIAPSRAETLCVAPERLVHAGVSLTRYFDRGEGVEAGLAGIQGSGWFLDATTIVTVAHVVDAMNLSTQEWKTIQISDGDETRLILARTRRLAGRESDELAAIELQTAIPSARPLALRAVPLMPDEHVVAPAYSAGRLRVVAGRFVRYGGEGDVVGRALLEMHDSNDRLAIDHGASGAPVLDCDGRVAAVVTNVVTQTLAFAGREIRVSTAWGTPNVVSVPVRALQASSQAK